MSLYLAVAMTTKIPKVSQSSEKGNKAVILKGLLSNLELLKGNIQHIQMYFISVYMVAYIYAHI